MMAPFYKHIFHPKRKVRLGLVRHPCRGVTEANSRCAEPIMYWTRNMVVTMMSPLSTNYLSSAERLSSIQLRTSRILHCSFFARRKHEGGATAPSVKGSPSATQSVLSIHIFEKFLLYVIPKPSTPSASSRAGSAN